MSPVATALALVGLQFATTSMIVGFASQASLLRLAGLPLTVSSAYRQFSQLEQIQHPIARAFLGAASVFAVILYVDAALLSQWTFDTRGPTSSMGGLAPVGSKGATNLEGQTGMQQPLIERLRFGLRISLQSRFPGTSWAVKNVPPFSRKEVDYVPTKMDFLVRHVFKCCVYIFILRLSGKLGKPAKNPVLFSSARIALFMRVREVTVSEVKTRLLGTLGYWAVQYLVIEVLYSILAILAIALHLTGVNVWPPVFGWLDEAWSLRKFWGCFYHQLIRQGCSSIAHFVIYACLRLRKGSLVTRYGLLAMVFTVSGVFHLLSDISQGIPKAESGAMQFFGVQTIGIIVEDAIQALFSKVQGRKRGVGSRFVTRVTGYLWVIAWLTWTSPIWIYPIMSRDSGTPIIPF